MPRHHARETRVPEDLSPPEDCPEDPLAGAVSATSLSFVACGAAVADLGDLLRDLRLALHVAGPPDASADREARLLAARLKSVRRALHQTTAAVGALLEDCVPAAGVGLPASRACFGGPPSSRPSSAISPTPAGRLRSPATLPNPGG